MDREIIEFLIRNLSHEIKNPLTTIKGYLQLSQMKKSDSGFLDKSVPVMISQVERIEKILDVLYPVFARKKEVIRNYCLKTVFEEFLHALPDTVSSQVHLNLNDENFLTDQILFTSILDSLIGKFDWHSYPDVVCDISCKNKNGVFAVEIAFSGADFPSVDNVSYFTPYANKTFYPSGIDLYEALWTADLLGIKLSNGAHAGIFRLEIQ